MVLYWDEPPMLGHSHKPRPVLLCYNEYVFTSDQSLQVFSPSCLATLHQFNDTLSMVLKYAFCCKSPVIVSVMKIVSFCSSSLTVISSMVISQKKQHLMCLFQNVVVI